MANVAIHVDVRSNGEVVLGKLGNAIKATDEKAKGLTSRMGAFAGAAAQTSKALARSADVFGLNATALRALDDTMDVAEMGFSNLSKSAVGFNAATLGVAAAAGAVGFAFGSWLRTFPAVQKVADSFIGTLYRLTQSQKELDAQAGAMQGLKQFSDRMAAADLEAKKKQMAWLKSQGKTDKEIADFFGGKTGAATAVVGQEAQLRALGLDDASLQKRKKAQQEAEEHQRKLLELTRDYNKALASVVTYREDDADLVRYLNEQSEALVRDMEKITADSLGALKGTRLREGDMIFGDSGLWTRNQDVIDQEMQNIIDRQQVALEQERALADEAARWQGLLQGVALLAGAIGGRLGEAMIAAANIAESFKGWKNMTGAERFMTVAGGFGQLGGVIGGRTGAALQGAAGGAMAGFSVGGPIGAAIGGVAGLIGGIFGHNKQKEQERKEALSQFEEIKRQLIEQYGSWEQVNSVAAKYGVTLTEVTDKKSLEKFNAEMELLEKRMKGLQTAVTGVTTLIDNLTYTDAAGKVLSTFSDPKVAEAAAGLFGATFWQVFQKEGIAGIDKLRPAWEKLHEQLIKMGLDPVKMGLGRVGQLMDITKDPKTKALLGVSQGAGQLLRGALDAGYVDQGFLKDSTTIARTTLQELQGQGLDANTAAQAMADQLVALNQAYAATGQEMPEDLKAAMEAAGITVLPTQLEVMKESRDYLKQIAGAAGHAEGAIVTRPHLAWVGEQGPEAIIPLRGRNAGLGSPAVSVTIQRSLGVTRETEYAFDRRVERTMRRLLRQNSAVRYDTRVAVNGGR